MATVSVRSAIGASFGFVGQGWTRAYGALLFAICLAVAYQFSKSDRSWALLGSALYLLLSLVVGTMAGGALYRTALEPDHTGDPDFRPGPAGFQWGRFEWRLLGGRLLLGLILGVLVFVVFMIWAIALGVLIGSHQLNATDLTSVRGVEVLRRLVSGPAGPATLLILGPGFLAIFYVYARLLLLPVMAAEKGWFDLGRAIALTRGATLAIMVGAIVLALAGFVLGALGGAVAGFARGLVGGLLRLPRGAAAGAFWGGLAGAALATAFSAPATTGLITHIYRAQRGGADSLAETFS